MIKDFFSDELISVILYGSITFDDLAPGYGDLDFLAVVKNDLSDEICRRLAELRRPLRSGDYGVFAKMLEGAFLPRGMLNPNNAGKAFWWGTSNERIWSENQLGWLVLHCIRERGIVIWGEDIRSEIPAARHEDLIKDVWMACKSMKLHGQGGDLHAVDWLLTAARLLLWLKERRISSKRDAADWGFKNVIGAWRTLLPQAKEIRLNPSMVDSVEVKKWLDTLTEPIREAYEELVQELVKQGFGHLAPADKIS